MSKFIPRCHVSNHVYTGIYYHKPYNNNNSRLYAPLEPESGGWFSRIVGFFSAARRFLSKPSTNFKRDKKEAWQYEYEQFLDEGDYNHDYRR